MSERLREERFGRKLLFFEVRIEDHGQISNKNATKPRGANLVRLQQNKTFKPDAAAGQLTDGLTPASVHAPYLGHFPYLGVPYSGYNEPS